MRRFSTLVIVLAFGSLLCFAPAAQADVVLFLDNFESYVQHYTSAIDSLPGLTPTVGAPWTGSGSYVFNSTQANPPGASGDGTQFAGLTDAPGAWSASAHLTAASTLAATNRVVTFDWLAYIKTGVKADRVRVGAAGTSGYCGPYFYLYGDGSIDWIPTWPDAAVPVTGTFATGTWIPIHMDVDYAAQTYTATVGTVSFTGTSFYYDTSHTVVSLNFYADGNSSGGSQFFIDQVSISTVPEPSTLALLAIGVMTLTVYAWRKRKA